MFLNSLFNENIKPIMNAGLFLWKNLTNYFALMGPHYFLSAPYVFSATIYGENETNADKRWMLCSILLHFGGLLPRGPSRQLQNRIAADLSNFQLQKKLEAPMF